ncbi:hypothetical protein FHR85_002917 [Alkalibacillus almallahensis]|nr:hypothetical protein [Alkalibacillus almallahensis]
MSKLVKTMLSWIILFPILTTSLLIVIDYFMGIPIELTSYSPYLLGFAVGGMFSGLLMYYIQGLNEK